MTPVDIPEEALTMGGPTRKYHAVVNGTKTILKLSERDAATMPGVIGPVDDAPAQPAVTPPADATPAKTRRAPANKARRSPNKAQE